MLVYAYGFPRLGKEREYKKTLEAFWDKKINEKQLIDNLKKIESERLSIYQNYVDLYPEGEITLYDSILDLGFMFNIYRDFSIENYYNLARGENALPMKKFFNTNYHYIKIEISQEDDIKFSWDKYEFFGIKDPKILYIIGPYTLLKLSKINGNEEIILDKLIKAYSQLFEKYKNTIFHIEEPAFVLEYSKDEMNKILNTYKKLENYWDRINLITYYESIDHPELIENIEVNAWGFDFIRGIKNLDIISSINPKSKIIAGVIDSRSVFPKNGEFINKVLYEIKNKVNNEIIISSAGGLFLLPITTKVEKNEYIKNNLRFAIEKLEELNFLKNLEINPSNFSLEKETFEIPEKTRESYEERLKAQSYLNLPLFPTTTIGSFPQTPEVRSMRLKYRKGEISKEEYDKFIKKEIEKTIRFQEELGLDVLVHGEFERTDMVEFFAEKLDGILTTKKGWVISYGSRVYRPPIIIGNIKRIEPMTINEIVYAQSLTKKPVKGMLTGPITIIAWSYVNPEYPIEKIAYEIASALQEEVQDYIRNGIKIIQIDEPAFREMTPIKKRDWDRYFNWAIKAFKLASYAPKEIQIHTHMCYSEFGDIIDKIDALDADVISIETTKSKGELIEAFEKYNYKRQIGLGVYDIHSPKTPKVEDIIEIVERALRIIPKENFWINPDCGLKTRKWEEVKPSLENMMKAAYIIRKKYS